METDAVHSVSKDSIRGNIGQLLSQAFPFAIWREPSSSDFNFLLSFNEEPLYQKVDLEKAGAGFFLAPFEVLKLPIFIKSDIHQTFKNFDEILNDEFIDDFGVKRIRFEKTETAKRSLDYSFDFNESGKEKQKFITDVGKAIEYISLGAIEKVVLSRKVTFPSPPGLDIISHFEKLCSLHSSAFCSLVYLPWSNEIWLGATPETLVEQSEDGVFKTMALAGTQVSTNSESGEEISNNEALWSQKEIEEQALVSRFIINCFKKIRVREFLENGPKTIKAGSLLHLQTDFLVNTKVIAYPDLSSTMLELLHPTSAVCGMPKEKALRFIKQTETHDREFYSGFLGPVNINESSKLYVNLRNLKVKDGEISLFAGCGITKDSKPEKEWRETQMKLRTVLAQR